MLFQPETVLNVMNLYQTNKIYVIVFGNNTSLVMVVEGGVVFCSITAIYDVLMQVLHILVHVADLER